MNAAARLELVRAVNDTLLSLELRDQAAPGAHVMVGAMTALGRPGIAVRRALSYDVPSESHPGVVHVVALYLKLKRDRWTHGMGGSGPGDWHNDITGARCSCPNRAVLHDPPATGGRPPCRHIIVALALARLEGYRLEVPKS